VYTSTDRIFDKVRARAAGLENGLAGANRQEKIGKTVE